MEFMATINGFDFLMLAIGYLLGYLVGKSNKSTLPTNFKYNRRV